jgi:hypothetical protein
MENTFEENTFNETSQNRYRKNGREGDGSYISLFIADSHPNSHDPVSTAGQGVLEGRTMVSRLLMC